LTAAARLAQIDSAKLKHVGMEISNESTLFTDGPIVLSLCGVQLPDRRGYLCRIA
jgi:hypothetical protein